MNILAVDDDQDTRRLYVAMFEHLGPVITAGTKLEAIEKFQGNQATIGLIIVDGCIDSREVDGVLLVRQFRNEGFTGPIVAMTGDETHTDRLMQAGCDDGCQKPRTDKLYEIVSYLFPS